MINSLQALILRRGNVVRLKVARPATVARYLASVAPLADYQVRYWRGRGVHVTAEEFLTRYARGDFDRVEREG